MPDTLKRYAVDSHDGYSRDFEASDDGAAMREARRIAQDDWGLNKGAGIEVWDLVYDVLVGSLRV